MKEKIIIFVVGLLLGAIISTGSIYFYTVASSSNNNNQNIQMNGTNPPSMPSDFNGGNGQPPSMPNGNNSQNISETSSN